MLQIPSIEFFIHSPLRPLQDSVFVALISRSYFSVTWVFIPVSWKAAHIHVSPTDDFLLPVKFYQGRLRSCHHQHVVGQIKLLHNQRTWSIHVAHAQQICCFQEADLLYTHSTVTFHIVTLHMHLCPEASNCMHALCVHVYILHRKDLVETCQPWSRNITWQS